MHYIQNVYFHSMKIFAFKIDLSRIAINSFGGGGGGKNKKNTFLEII